MPLGIPVLVIAAMIATVVAGLAVSARGGLEAFLAAWFLVFILALIALPFLPNYFGV